MTIREARLRFRREQKSVLALRLSFEDYLIEEGIILSNIIADLRRRGIPGRIRAQYNNAMQAYQLRETREYLYRLDPSCRICGQPFTSIKEVTIDHIIPVAHGGTKDSANKQLAHAYCNSVTKNNEDMKKYGNSHRITKKRDMHTNPIRGVGTLIDAEP